MVTQVADNIIYVPADTLRDIGRKALSRVGVHDDIIEPVVEGLVWTSLRGIDSHGIRLLPHYVAGVQGGRINPAPKMTFEQTAPSIGIVDAEDTFGHAAGMKAMKHAIDMANESGIAAIAVKNSSHCGALSFFAHEAARNDMIGIVMTHATARVKSPRSNRAFFGNNPICLVAPMRNEEPFCFDAATTAITFNKVKALAAAGQLVPQGMVADSEGVETTDPNRAEQLLPIGDYKGFGLSMMVDVLCALLTGMPSGNHVSKMFGDPMSKKRKLGHFFCAIRIDAFRDVDAFKADLQEMADRVRREPVIDPSKQRVMVPGDPEKMAWGERVRIGIPVLESDWSKMNKGTETKVFLDLQNSKF